MIKMRPEAFKDILEKVDVWVKLTQCVPQGFTRIRAKNGWKK